MCVCAKPLSYCILHAAVDFPPEPHDIRVGTAPHIHERLKLVLRYAGSADGRSTLFGIPAVYSTEPLRQPGADSLEAIGAEPGSRIGFGSFVSVTGSAGLRLAGIVINDIAGAQNTAD